MPQLVQGGPVPVDRLEIGLWRRHLNIIVRWNIEGLVPTDAKVDSGRPDQRLDPWLDHVGRRWRRLDSNILRQALALRGVEHGEALEERDRVRFLAGLPRALPLVVGDESVGIDDDGAVLSLPDLAAERLGLEIGEPALSGIAVLDDGAPEDEDVDAGILAAGSRVPRHRQRRLRLGRAPGLDPGDAAGLELGDDLVGDVVIKARPVVAGPGAAVISGHRDFSATGLGSLSPDPSPSRQTRPASHSKGALRGLPAEGGAPAT